MASQYAESGDARGTFLGHPKGLFVLFFAEMWERFSYYGMRALLIFYLTKHWLFSDGDAGVIYGAYTALVYITPVLGGYLADRYLGQRKAVAYGAVLLTFGHFLMGFEGSGGDDAFALNMFWLALAFIIVGSGFLKANISVIVGQLYPRTDTRRDPAYTIFYMGINLGAFLGSLLCGYLGEEYGWSYGFGAAGVGMLLGLIVFIWGKPLLVGRGEAPAPLSKGKEWGLYVVGLLAVVLCWWMVQNQDVVGTLLGIFGAILVLGVVFYSIIKLPAHDRDRIFAALFLIFVSIVFWALFEQAGNSLNLFTDRYVDRMGVPASMFQSLNAAYIFLLAPVFAAIWTALGRHNREPSAPFKFGLGVIQVGLGFLVLVWGAQAAGMDNSVPVIFIFLIYLLHTTGELSLSPVGLSAMNRLAPAHMASLIMGTWFFASATGNYAAGLISRAAGGDGLESAEAGKELVLGVYTTVGWYGIGIGVAVLAISPLVKKLMHLDTLRDDSEELLGDSEAGLEAQEAGVHPENTPRA
ncbi:peptide MFS transporter [Altericroceibacterium spongiae]|uniref:Peptide MFS transporter n=1 Tax=Altericroceibacterium spongiae TaxID=2320269 RepID=A0A420EP78_9SPHN|nr:peptide MFS transporter [Altericroceibacterium spongiae]RKF22480.1 peptide MFS transporter [Altericroceibacterium spongiae]